MADLENTNDSARSADIGSKLATLGQVKNVLDYSKKEITELKSDLTELGYATKTFEMKANQSHSSTKDRIRFSAMANELYWLSVNVSNGEEKKVQVYEIEADGTSTQNGTIKTNEEYPIYANKNFVEIGLFLGSSSSDIVVSVVLNKKDSIFKETNRINNESGYNNIIATNALLNIKEPFRVSGWVKGYIGGNNIHSVDNNRISTIDLHDFIVGKKIKNVIGSELQYQFLWYDNAGNFQYESGQKNNTVENVTTVPYPYARIIILKTGVNISDGQKLGFIYDDDIWGELKNTNLDIAKVKNDIVIGQKQVGYETHSIELKAGSTHSSTKDRFHVNIPNGNVFYVRSETNNGDSFTTQIHMIDKNGNDISSGNIVIGAEKKITAPFDIEQIGVFTSSPTTDCILTTRIVMVDSPLKINVWNSGDLTYNINTGSKVKEYTDLVNDSSATEQFIFFTDPHLYQMEDENNLRTHEFITTLQKYYNSTPTDFVLCGGDWLGSNDTKEIAQYKLGYIDGFMRTIFKRYYPILGNHDTNYQGYDEAGKKYDEGGHPQFSNNKIANLLFRNYKKPYYSFDGNHTKFYVLDTQIDWTHTTMSEYLWGQIDWLADSLLSDDKEHSAICMHIWWWGSPSSGLPIFSQNVSSIINAYNGKTEITLNGKSYNFSNTQGRIEFVISGHSHSDLSDKIGNVPVILTTHFREGNTPTFDMIYVDYQNSTFSCIRVGAGNNRKFSLSTGDVI